MRNSVSKWPLSTVAAAYATGGEALPAYIGKQYESVCLQWIQRKNAVGECKWRNRFDWAEAARVLEHRAQLLKGFNEQSLCLFTKNRLNESAVDELRVKGVKTVCAEDLYV